MLLEEGRSRKRPKRRGRRSSSMRARRRRTTRSAWRRSRSSISTKPSASSRRSCELNPRAAARADATGAVAAGSRRHRARRQRCPEGGRGDADGAGSRGSARPRPPRRGRAREAQQTLAAQISRQPDAAVLRTELGWVLLDRRDWPGARKSFEEALRLAPESIEARTGLVTAYLGQGQNAAAQARVDEWLARSPETAASACSRLVSPWSPGVPPKPSAFSATSSSNDPGHLEAYDLLGRMYVASGDMTRAYDEYQALAARSPAAAGPRTMAAMIDEARGKRDAAVAELRTRAGRQSPRRRCGQQPRLDSGGRGPRSTTRSGWPGSPSTR